MIQIPTDVDEKVSLVRFVDLIPEELEKSGIPDEFLASVRVNFESKQGRHYTAKHNPEHPHGPYILLAQTDYDSLDMVKVGGEIRRANGLWYNRFLMYPFSGHPLILPRSDDISAVIRLKDKPTQASVARLVGDYKV